jgi:hypothetical protein
MLTASAAAPEADLEEIGDYTLEHWGDAKLVEYVTMLNDAFAHSPPIPTSAGRPMRSQGLLPRIGGRRGCACRPPPGRRPDHPGGCDASLTSHVRTTAGHKNTSPLQASAA